jgi:ABC-type glycerol-3-phosphate transport system substrate-binding protein
VPRALLLLLAVLALAGCGGGKTAAPPPGGVRELANVLDLRAAFEADAGKPRVVILFSPT